MYKLILITIQGLLILGLLFGSVWVHAASVAMTEAAEGNKAGQKRLSIYSGFSLSSNLKNEGPEKTTGLALTLYPTYRFKSGHKASVFLVGGKDLTDERIQNLTSAQLRWGMPGQKFLNGILILPRINLQYPSTAEHVRRLGMRSVVSAQLTTILPKSMLKLDGLSVIYIPRLTRGFYTKEVSTTGKSLNEYALSHTLVGSYQITDKLSIELAGLYSTGWTFQGNVRENFNISEELSWQLNSKISLAIGHSNSGNVKAANGESIDIDIYDPNASEVYGSVSYMY